MYACIREIKRHVRKWGPHREGDNLYPGKTSRKGNLFGKTFLRSCIYIHIK